MRAIFAVGPYGCLLLAVAIGVAIIFNDLRFHRRFVSLFFFDHASAMGVLHGSFCDHEFY